MLMPPSEMHQQQHGGFATVHGISMYYEVYERSDKIPLVLIHGGGSTIPSNWATLLPLLMPYYHVIAMELQAHGRSSDRDAPESFHQERPMYWPCLITSAWIRRSL